MTQIFHDTNLGSIDMECLNNLKKLADDLNFRRGGKPCTSQLLRAISKLDAMALEELLEDAKEID